MCSFTWSNDQELVRVQLVGKQKACILLVLLAIRWNSKYQDDNEIKKTSSCLLMLSGYYFTPSVAVQNPK